MQLAGIALEQHADRTRLFMQWKRMKWPVMVDAFNLLEMRAVPVSLLLDEHGVVRYINPKEAELARFLATDYEAPAADVRDSATEARTSPSMAFAIDVVALTQEEDYGRAIDGLEAGVTDEPGSGLEHFRLGVLYRKRYDSDYRESDDFRRAILHWEEALRLDPNQYIWRRRIQQYGPRLDKPYPFYDWVGSARAEIRERGEAPHALVVEPRGAELAHPLPGKVVGAERSELDHPDPGNALALDDGLIDLEITMVPGTGSHSSAARVHVVMRPDPDRRGHWNNEAGKTSLWVVGPEGMRVDPMPVVFLPTDTLPEVSDEPRHLEFEVTRSEARGRGGLIKAEVFYYVCEGEAGVCRFLRQAFEVDLAGH